MNLSHSRAVYYFNAATGMSQWEPPLWLDEIDPTTGAVYYVNSYTGDPQVRRSLPSPPFPPGVPVDPDCVLTLQSLSVYRCTK